ncbi:FadR/GntR family transcriptional regulator [Caballeronia sp. 15711]|uniref:FadR/GntR family transcriptional regulator n=1 Tax=unclassified Caballeronia TaxID=2646786 RepID=UPI0039E5913E
MPIKAIEPQRLYRQISDQLRALIMNGEFAVGTRLPAERDLAVQLGVSRPSLREALIALEVEGLIEVRVSSGIYVRALRQPRNNDVLDLSSEEGPLELIRARKMVEGEVAATAAKTGRKAQFDVMEEAINTMETQIAAGVNPLEADRAFHVCLAEATGNSVLVGLVARLFDARMGPLFDLLNSHFDTTAVWAQAVAEHRAILSALRARDSTAARAAMHKHMDVSFKRLTSSLTQEATTDSVAAPAGDTGNSRKRPA